jgi:hypothetical protein
MPARWTIDHSEKLVEAVIDGVVGLEEAIAFFDALEAENAVSYRKLIDATSAPAKIDSQIMAIVGARMARNRSEAAFAVVVPSSGPLDGLARLYLLVVDSDSGRARVFRDKAEARQWLETRK